jgi:hypothetical protein
MRSLWQRYRLGILLGGGLLLALWLMAAVAGSGPRGVLDPEGYDPDGAHALKVLLQRQGVAVTRTTDVPSTVQAATQDTTVFVPLPSLLSPDELASLAQAPGELVVAEADADALAALATDVRAVGLEDSKDRDPSCPDEVAANAGRALTGGIVYRSERGTSCYPAGDGAGLVTTDGLTLLGAADALTNKHLDEEGDAALGIGLLGRHATVLWLVPSPTRLAFGERPHQKPEDLLPHWLHLVRWQLLVAAGVLALWRGRRLGRVVLERLPVVVRASETVEGHGRMYQAAGARGTAAEALREAARRSLTRLAHGGTVTPEVLVDLVAARSPREPVAVQRLLYGPTPTDDAALVRLARDLDALVHEALTREAAGT